MCRANNSVCSHTNCELSTAAAAVYRDILSILTRTFELHISSTFNHVAHCATKFFSTSFSIYLCTKLFHWLRQILFDFLLFWFLFLFLLFENVTWVNFRNQIDYIWSDGVFLPTSNCQWWWCVFIFRVVSLLRCIGFATRTFRLYNVSSRNK